MEEQAIGTALRLGEESQVVLVRYITAKTVEHVWKQLVLLSFSLTVSRPICISPKNRTAAGGWGIRQREERIVGNFRVAAGK